MGLGNTNSCPRKRIGTSQEFANAGNTDNAWMVNFNNGRTNWNNRNNNNYVRPVRQHFLSSPAVLKLLSEIFTLEKIYYAYLDCRKRKKNTINALKFEIDREKNLVTLLQELKSRKYQVSKHIYFIVQDPTPREIFAADFRDRVVHHLLCNEIGELFEKGFIDDSFANRRGKGTHKGVSKLIEYLRVENKESYYLKLDVKSFFRSINKDILWRLVEEKIKASEKSSSWKWEILWLCKIIIYHDPTKNYSFKGNEKLKKLIPDEKSLFYAGGKGLPIGNLTSQFFANIYLNELDQFMKSSGHKHYVRYVDDFVILGGKGLIKDVSKVEEFLQLKLNLKLAPKKIKFQQISKGIDFLGYYIKPDYVLVRRKIVGRLKAKIRTLSTSNLSQALSVINSYLGHFQHANSFKLRKDIYWKYFSRYFNYEKEYISLKRYKENR